MGFAVRSQNKPPRRHPLLFAGTLFIVAFLVCGCAPKFNVTINAPKSTSNSGGGSSGPSILCSASGSGFLAQEGGGSETTGTAVLRTSSGTLVAGNNVMGATAQDQLAGATEYGVGGDDGTSVYVSEYDSSGKVLWTSEYGYTNATATTTGVVQDSSGNVYVGGYVSCVSGQTCSFGGTLVGSLSDGLASTAGNSDAFIIKLNSNGVPQWVSELKGGTAASGPTLTANALTIDSSGNLYLAGGTVNSLGGSMSGSHGAEDAYVAQFTPAGALGYTSEVGHGSSTTLVANGVLVDTSGHLFIAGQATGALMGQQLSYYAHGFTDVFVSMFTASTGAIDQSSSWGSTYGNWGAPYGVQVGNGGNMWGGGLAEDSSGNVYVSGFTDGLLTSAPLSGTLHGTHGNKDLFVLKFNSAGTYQSADQYGAQNTSMSLSSAAQSGLGQDSSGNLYLVGMANGYLGGGCYCGCGTANDLFVAQYNPSSSSFGWLSQLGPSAAFGPQGIATDSSGNSYFASLTSDYLSSEYYGTHSEDALVGSISSAGAMGVTASTPPAVTGPIFPVQLGVASATTKANGVAQDVSGNSLVVGSTTGSISGATQIGTHGSKDVLVSKFDSSGNSKWNTQVAGGSGTNTDSNAIATDTSGNAYFIGDTSGSAGTQVGTHGSTDLLISKLNSSNGSQVWSTQLGTGSSTIVSGQGIVLDSSNNSYVTGYASSSLGGIQTGTEGANDILVAGFSSSGGKSFANQLGAGAGTTSQGLGIASDGAGNLYVAGYTSGSFSGLTGWAQYGAHGTDDLVLAKYSTAGAYEWVVQLGVSSKVTEGFGVVVDNSGNIDVVGYTAGSLGYTQSGVHGSQDLVVASFSSSGALNWVNQLGGQYPCFGGESCTGMQMANTYGYGIVQDSNGELVVTGKTTGMIPGANQYKSHGANPNSGTENYDALVAAFSKTGTYQWASQMGLTNSNTYGLGIAKSAVSGSAAYVVGYADGYLGGTQNGTHGTEDLVLFRTDSNGVLP